MPRPAATCSSVSSTPRTRYPAVGCGRLVGCVLASRFQTSGSPVRSASLICSRLGQSMADGQHRHPRLGVQRGDAQAGLV